MTGLTSYFSTRLYGSDCQPNKADNLRQLMRTKSLDAAELLYVGDTRSDFEAADTAGVQCLTAAWDPNQPIVEAGDQIVFTSVEQLWAYLQRRLG
ncbi:HAD family hydrolase [Lactiplantibacillus plantarum]|uniref:HAD family hydrolase n=1 Tax=Lactiplantibacillus plantarum TaxID=1590 RepID=UPI003F53D56A